MTLPRRRSEGATAGCPVDCAALSRMQRGPALSLSRGRKAGEAHRFEPEPSGRRNQRQWSSAAIVDGRTREENIYQVGDMIQNARIVQILPDRVILDVGNQQENSARVPSRSAPGSGAPDEQAARKR